MVALPAADPAAARKTRAGSPIAAPVIVATRGDAASDGAIGLALSMATATGCPVRLLGVIEPAPDVATELGAMVYVPPDEVAGRASLQRAIEAQLRRLGVRSRKVAIDIRVGDPSAVIVHAARDAAASLILIGAAEHGMLERVFGADTAVRVARSADVPMLVVPRTCTQLPESAVVAVDFSDESVRAARAALALFPDPEAVHLVHVAPSPQPALELVSAWEGRYMDNAERAFEKVRDALPLPTGTVVGRHIVRGSPARELLRVARERRVDMIVAGSHGHSALKRIFVGSVATTLLREATVPVFILPARAGAGIRDQHVQTFRDPMMWPKVLDEFSERNTGRRATLEVDDPEIGAQAQEVDYPFRGCVYDPFDGRLAVMLGDERTGARHLTRGIASVSEVDVLRGDDGRDRVLRIAHGRQGGQTMVVFTS